MKKQQKGEHRQQQPRWRVWLVVILAIFINIGFFNAALGALFRPIEDPDYGASFSIKYAEELGLDWREAYAATTDELHLKSLRLMSYWDLYEKTNDTYDFTDLDWQMDKAAERGVKVSLSVGFRQPRWPECHQPGWAKDLGEESDTWKSELYEYIETVVSRYKNHPALLSYQLENEALNRFFGDCQQAAPRERLQEELALVKKADPNHPVWMSLSDQHGFPAGSPVPDAYGFSVYRTVWNDLLPVDFYVTYPTPVWYHRARKWLIENIKDRPVFIHELQMEPWGPRATKDLSVEEQNNSMSLERMKSNLNFARRIGAKDIYLWGTEWWYWRKIKFNDPGPWELIKSEINH